MCNWEDISYLKNGSDRQCKVYNVLLETGILTELREFNPMLAGTVPIDIALPQSDLDIICEVYDMRPFRELVCRLYSCHDGFSIKEYNNIFIATFMQNDFMIEIFARPTPVKQQEAYRHMVVEYRLLKLLGESFRKEIIKTKSTGIKTEPAFCKVLDIKGDSYQALLELEKYSDDDLSVMFSNKPIRFQKPDRF